MQTHGSNSSSKDDTPLTQNKNMWNNNKTILIASNITKMALEQVLCSPTTHHFTMQLAYTHW